MNKDDEREWSLRGQEKPPMGDPLSVVPSMPSSPMLELESVAAAYSITGPQRQVLLEQVQEAWFYGPHLGELFTLAKRGLTLAAALEEMRLTGRPLPFDFNPAAMQEKVGKIAKTFGNYNAASVAEMLYRLYVRRESMRLGAGIMQQAYDGEQRLVEDGGRLIELAHPHGGIDLGFDEVVGDVLTRARDGLSEDQAEAFGWPTVDRITRGIQRCELVVISGRPGFGKTTFAENIAVNRARHDYGKVLFFSFEMSKEQVLRDLISIHSGIPLDALTHGFEDADRKVGMEKLAHSLSWVDKRFLVMEPGSSRCERTSSWILSMVRKVRAELAIKEEKLDMVVIDYFQLLAAPQRLKGDKEKGKNEYLSEYSMDFKLFSLQEKVPILLIARTNRYGSHRDKDDSLPFARPQDSDLDGCGSLEFDAWKILFLIREPSVPETGYLYVLKNKSGPPHVWCKITFDGSCKRFGESA